VHEEGQIVLAKHRLEQARESLEAALRVGENGSHAIAARQAYYCMFHAMRAMQVTDSLDPKGHSRVISVFQRQYVKTGIFPAEFTGRIRDAHDIRDRSDHEDFVVVSKETAATQIENARTFLDAVETYLKTL